MPREPRTAADVLAAAGIDRAELRRVMPRVEPSRVAVREASPAFVRAWASGIRGVTTPWGVYLHPEVLARYRRGEDLAAAGRLVVHELMHVEQLHRTGIARHTLRYVGDYLRGRLRGASHWDAYRGVRFEVEARAAARLVSGRWR